MPYCPIVGTLAYILSEDKKKVLLIHRNAKKNDDHLGKYNGLGGKMEPCEDVLACICREIKEEAGIEVTSIRLKGTINWTSFGKNNEDWLGFIFVVDGFQGTPYTSNPEGTLEWVELDKIGSLPMWDGDRMFLPLVFDDDPRPFHGYMPYKDGLIQGWTYTRL